MTVIFCPFCGEPRGGKMICCGEIKFEECTDLEYEHMQGTGKSLVDVRSDFDKFVETHQHLRGEEE